MLETRGSKLFALKVCCLVSGIWRLKAERFMRGIWKKLWNQMNSSMRAAWGDALEEGVVENRMSQKSFSLPGRRCGLFLEKSRFLLNFLTSKPLNHKSVVSGLISGVWRLMSGVSGLGSQVLCLVSCVLCLLVSGHLFPHRTSRIGTTLSPWCVPNV